MKRFLLFTLFVLGLFATALAQERVVTGKVTDAANEPLPGVAVVQKVLLKVPLPI